MLNSEMVQLGVSADNPVSAIRCAGNLLITRGACSVSYVEAMIQRESEFPTAFPPGFALAHGTLSDLDQVYFSALSVVQLTKPIDWQGVEVSVVFGLAARPGENLDILGKVADLAQSPVQWARLLATRDVSEVLQLFN